MKKLSITFYVFYHEPGAAYLFNGKLVSDLQRRISRKSPPSEALLKKFPGVERLSLWLSASSKLNKGLISSGKYHRSASEVEFHLTLPYPSRRIGWRRTTAYGLKHTVFTIENLFVNFDIDVPEGWNNTDIIEMYSQAPESFVNLYELD